MNFAGVKGREPAIRCVLHQCQLSGPSGHRRATAATRDYSGKRQYQSRHFSCQTSSGGSGPMYSMSYAWHASMIISSSIDWPDLAPPGPDGEEIAR